jgi:hypothetical protein
MTGTPAPDYKNVSHLKRLIQTPGEDLQVFN